MMDTPVLRGSIAGNGAVVQGAAVQGITGSASAAVKLRDVVAARGPERLAGVPPRGIDLDVQHGEFVAVTCVQPGAAAVLRAVTAIIGCLDSPERGGCWIDGFEVTGLDECRLALVRNRAIGMVFRTPGLLPRATAAENVELPLKYGRVGRAERVRRVEAALGLVGLGGWGDRQAGSLTAFEQQLVAIARAVVGTPCLIVADDPTECLDPASGGRLMDIFSRLNAAGRTVVVVTQDPAVAARAGRTVSLVDGVVAKDDRLAAGNRSAARRVGGAPGQIPPQGGTDSDPYGEVYADDASPRGDRDQGTFGAAALADDRVGVGE